MNDATTAEDLIGPDTDDRSKRGPAPQRDHQPGSRYEQMSAKECNAFERWLRTGRE